jgi:hypothetical protein
MTSPGGKPVAQVSVRVVPDVDFNDLERQLRQIKDATIPVKLDIDRADLERQLQEIRDEDLRIPVNFDVDNIRDDVERATSGVRADDIEVPIEARLDRAAIQNEINFLRAEIEELSDLRADPEVNLRIKAAQDQLRALKADLARLEADSIDIRVTDSGIREVLGNATKVKVDLEAIARDPVTFQLELANNRLQAELAEVLVELERLDGMTATPEVDPQIDAAMAQLATVLAALEALDKKRVEAGVNIAVDGEAAASAQIAAFVARQQARNRVNIQLDVDNDSMLRIANRINNAFSAVRSGITQAISRTFSAAFGTASEGAGALGRQLAGLTGRAGRILAVLTQVGAAAAVLPVVGAAATAAWGALSAAISTIPSAIALIGVPIAAVALGMDGIKKAASRLAPEFAKLKGSISEVFADGLAPVFERLRGIFPLLTTGLKGVAGSLVGLADDMSRFVTSAGRMAQIEVILNRVTEALRKMSPGIQDILAGFLSLASQQGAFDVLTGAVNAFGAAFKKNVADTILNGDLDRALEGLEVLLMNLATAFAGLVKNGITVFANAAPGLNAAFLSISNFFGRFDWARLGREVGGVFAGLAKAIDDVDDQTIRDIEDAFGDLARTFNDPEFRAGLTNIIRGIGPAIRLFGQFAAVAVKVGSAVSTVLQKLDELQRFLDEKPNEPGGGILGADAKWWNDLIDQWDGFIQKVKDLWYDFTSWFSSREITEPLAQSFGGGGTGFFDFDFRLPTLPDFGDIDPPGLAPGWGDLDDAIGGFIDDATEAARDAIARMLGAVEIGLVSVRQAFSFEGVGIAVGLALLGMVGTVRLGMESLAQTVLTGMGPVNAAFNFEAVRTAVGVAFLGMVGTVTLGMASIANAVLAGMPAINTAFNFGSIRTAMGLAFLGMVGTVNLGMQSIANAVLAGMPLVNAAFNFEPVKLNLGLAFLAMVGTVNLGMQSIANAVLAGMPLINAAFNFAPVHVALGIAFLNMVGTVRLGMESIAVAVEEGVARIIAAMTGGMGGILAFWASNWAQVGSIVASAWNLIVSNIGGGIGRAISLVNGGLSQLVGLWRQNWATVLGIVSAGVGQVVAQFTSMASRALAALRIMVSGAATVGGSIISALVSAISSGAGRVISALRSLAERALAAAKAVIRPGSPSKVFLELGASIPQGLEVGIKAGIPGVLDAANKMADSAVSTADRINAAFSGDSWAADFNSKIEHSFGEMSAGLSNKDVVGQLRNMNGTASQSTMMMSTMIAVLQAILAQGQGSGGVALGAQGSRQRSELGAF